LTASTDGAPWVPLLTPIDASENPGRVFSDLAVTVHKAAAGAVTVQVFTLEGSPVALLYQGGLQPGTWVFDWNGKTQAAQAASPGYYEIRLESQSGTQKKIIQIH
jgi:flagellar hook assembly protein FlgD